MRALSSSVDFSVPVATTDHAEILHRRDERPGFVAAREHQHALARETVPQGADGRRYLFLLARDQHLGASNQIGIAEEAGEIAERLRSVGDAVEAAFEVRCAVVFAELARDMQHGLGADDHIGLRAVHGLHLAEAGIAREGA